MKCIKCGDSTYKSTTTDVTDLGKCLVIIRNVPCYKCNKCDEIFYTGDVVQVLEEIVKSASNLMQEVAIIDYTSAIE